MSTVKYGALVNWLKLRLRPDTAKRALRPFRYLFSTVTHARLAGWQDARHMGQFGSESPSPLTMTNPNIPILYDAEPHPYLHEPVLHISGLPSYVTDGEIALFFQPCTPMFRLKINREESHKELWGTIEFQYLGQGHLHSIRFTGSSHRP